MADLKLGGFGQGGVQNTLDALNNNGFGGIRPDGAKAKSYQELKAHVSQLGQNATLRVKNGNSARELALGTEGRVARWWKGDRNELTAHTIAKLVNSSLPGKSDERILSILRNPDGTYDVSRDRVLQAFNAVEEMYGLNTSNAPFQRKDLPSLQGTDAVKAFKDVYPNAPRAKVDGTFPPGVETLDGKYEVSGKFYGDVILRGTVKYNEKTENLEINNKPSGNPQQNLDEIYRFFSEKLGIDSSNKSLMQNYMNNILNYAHQDNYHGVVGFGAESVGLAGAASHDVRNEVSIGFRNGHVMMERRIDADLKDVDLPNYISKKETGWRFAATERFSLPFDTLAVPMHHYDAGQMRDASRVQYLEQGRRTFGA